MKKKEKEFKARWAELKGDRDISISDSPELNVIRGSENYDGYRLMVESEDLEGIILKLDKAKMMIKFGKNDKIKQFGVNNKYISEIEYVINAGVGEDLKIFIDRVNISIPEIENLSSGLIIVTDSVGRKTLYDYTNTGGLKTLGIYEPHQEHFLRKKILIEFNK